MKIIMTYAIEEETFCKECLLLDNGVEYSFIATGIGKTSSASLLTEAIIKNKPDGVINFGTAGTINLAVGDILVCRNFQDRDLQPINIEGLIKNISFEKSRLKPLWQSLIDGKMVDKNFTVATGDTFVTSPDYIQSDAVDMESFAQAWVCNKYDVPFLSVKYITDIVGKNSIKHWEDKLKDAREALSLFFTKNIELENYEK